MKQALRKREKGKSNFANSRAGRSKHTGTRKMGAENTGVIRRKPPRQSHLVVSRVATKNNGLLVFSGSDKNAGRPSIADIRRVTLSLPFCFSSIRYKRDARIVFQTIGDLGFPTSQSELASKQVKYRHLRNNKIQK